MQPPLAQSCAAGASISHYHACGKARAGKRSMKLANERMSMSEPTSGHGTGRHALHHPQSLAVVMAVVLVAIPGSLPAAALPTAAPARERVPVQLAPGRQAMPQQQNGQWGQRQQPGDWQGNPPRNWQPVPPGSRQQVPPGNWQQVPPGNWQPPPPANWQQQPGGGWQPHRPRQPLPQFDPGPGGYPTPPRDYPTPPRQYPSPLSPWPPDQRN